MSGPVVIVGDRGMLGRDLVDVLGAEHTVVGFDLPACDLATPGSLGAVARVAPSVVINCAALTDVDGCESRRDEAFAINGEGAGHLAAVARDCGAWLIQISTDYVFDGALDRPYREDDAVAPLSVYGASKLAGEQAVAAVGGAHLILRTQSLFGIHGKNFVAAIVAAAATRPHLEVVHDQVSAPTYTRHLAVGIARLLTRPDHAGLGSVLHLTASGACSWHAFAEAIVTRVKPGLEVRPIPAAALGRPAPRPPRAELDSSRFAELTGHRLPDWEVGLDAYLAAVRSAAAPT